MAGYPAGYPAIPDIRPNPKFSFKRIKIFFVKERLSDNGTLMYPSVTFCTKYIWQDFPGVMEILNNNKSMGFMVCILIFVSIYSIITNVRISV